MDEMGNTTEEILEAAIRAQFDEMVELAGPEGMLAFLETQPPEIQALLMEVIG